MFNLIYKTVNQINKKYYLGMHSTKCLNDGYLGSGFALRDAIAKYGRENFSREVLFVFDTRDEMIEKEKELITEEIVNDPMSYNLAVGGNGGNLKDKSEEHIERIRSSIVDLHANRSDEYKEQIKSKKVDTWVNKSREDLDAHATKISMALTGKKRKPFSDETRRKMGESKKKVKWYTNGSEVKRCIPGTEPKGFVLGRK